MRVQRCSGDAGISATIEGRRLPTSADGANYAVVLGFLCLRAVNVVQLVASLPGGLARSTRPTLDAALVALFCAETAILTVYLRRGRVWTPPLVWCDVAVGCVVLIGQSAVTAPTDRLDTWDAWGYAVTLSCALAAGVGLRHRRQVLTAAVALMACYLWESLLVGQVTQWSTAATNSVGYLAFATAGWVTAGYLRRMGRDADQFREQVGVLAARAEAERHRRLLHDQATVLGLLSRDVTDPRLLDALRRQAASGASRINSFLEGRPQIGDGRTLGAGIRLAALEFTDLPLTVNVDLVDALVVDEEVGAAVRSAVTTLLHNVRLHSQASSCVVHADGDAQAGSWEIVVTDDGNGFEINTTEGTRAGFGLRGQVVEPLNELGVRVHLASSPGVGTTVTLTRAASPV